MCSSRAKWSPGGAGSVITAAAATSSSPLPCFDPATPAMPRAPVDGAAARAHKAARRLPSTQGSGAEAPSKDAAVPVAACGVQSATQQSLISLDERGFGLTALSDQQGMQLDAAFAAAIGGDDGAAESEQQLPLCVMRPVVNLPYRGKMAAEATVAAKPRQGHQASDVARAPAPGRRSALQGLPGPAVVSLGALSGKAAEQATAAHRAATPAPSLLDQLCAEIEHAGTSGNGAAAMEVGPPCKTSPTVIGTCSARPLLRAHLSGHHNDCTCCGPISKQLLCSSRYTVDQAALCSCDADGSSESSQTAGCGSVTWRLTLFQGEVRCSS